jgi:hypothetical protein
LSSANDVGVVPVIEEQMSLGLGDLSDDACQKLEGVDFLEAREELARLVVRGFGSVEYVRRAWAPLHSGQAYWRTKHVPSDVLESIAFAGGDANGIIDVETAPPPRQKELDALVAQEVLLF